MYDFDGCKGEGSGRGGVYSGSAVPTRRVRDGRAFEQRYRPHPCQGEER